MLETRWPLPVLPIGRGGSQPKLRWFLLLLLCTLTPPITHTVASFLMNSRAKIQCFPDGLPSESPEHADGLPCSAVFENSSFLDRILQKRYSIGILRDFHVGESSESLRQSQLDQVQIVPATLISSELSAHQMAARSDGSLARSGVDDHYRIYSYCASILFLFLLVRRSLLQKGAWSRASVMGARSGVRDLRRQSTGRKWNRPIPEHPVPKQAVRLISLYGSLLLSERIQRRLILRGDEELVSLE